MQLDSNVFWLVITFLSVPFVCLATMYCVIVGLNKKTTGEIKYILPPDVLLKVMAVFMVASVILCLAVLDIIKESTVSALLGAIATGVLGFSSKSKNDKENG